ncbi:uncharacterized protein LOC135843411 [Planococcus citri]|uniref:uncharacterized protein LOC135843411 n=1 Tax=Planococcus citri TaxID=170843 RepID=UPI0031F74B9D
MEPIYFSHKIKTDDLPPNSVIVSDVGNVCEIRCAIREYAECNSWHSHPLNAPSVLKHLSPEDPLRAEFHNYFEMRMSVTAASHYHENKLMLESESNDNAFNEEYCLDNARINPTKRTVQHWFDVWRKSQWGSNDGSTLKTNLEKAITHHSSQGIKIQYCEEPFTLVLISPMMARTHECEFSKRILFIDSTSCCDSENYSITFLLSATPAGAVPCGVLITKQQTMDAFTTGFTLLKNMMASLGGSFFKQEFPNVIMTDNCAAEIGAAKIVWPESILLLCIFHVLQYVLRWLQDGSHGIPKDRQRDFISCFQTILYCTDENEAENAFIAALEIGHEFPQWQEYLTHQYSIKEKWCLAFRKIFWIDAFIAALEIGHEFPQWQEYLTHQYSIKEKWCLAFRVGVTNHHTNNFAEISIRIFKENILDRVKAYNLIALLEFLATTLDTFYKRKLREFYTSRDRKNDRFLHVVLKRAEGITPVKIDEFTFHVASQTVPGTTYTVDSRSGLCTCKGGQVGKFCKHSAAVYNHFDVGFNHMPSVTMECRREVAYVAIGSKIDTLPKEYFLPLHVNELTEKERALIRSSLPESESTESNSVETSVLVPPPQSMNNINEVDTNDNRDVLASESEAQSTSTFSDFLNLLQKLDDKFGSSKEGIRKAIARAGKCTSPGQWETALHTFGKNIPLRRAIGAKIKVQPTGIQRRRGKMSARKSEKKHRISTRMYA